MCMILKIQALIAKDVIWQFFERVALLVLHRSIRHHLYFFLFINRLPWHRSIPSANILQPHSLASNPYSKDSEDRTTKISNPIEKVCLEPAEIFLRIVFFLITIDCESAPTSIVCMYAFECRYQDLFQKSFSDIRYLFQVLDIRTFRFGKCVFTLKHGSPHLPICCVIFLF